MFAVHYYYFHQTHRAYRFEHTQTQQLPHKCIVGREAETFYLYNALTNPVQVLKVIFFVFENIHRHEALARSLLTTIYSTEYRYIYTCKS